MVEDKPAPRPMETNPLIAPDYMPLIDDNLQSGLGAIPGETPSERLEIQDDGYLKPGLGVIPG